jgi:hypothetical protein
MKYYACIKNNIVENTLVFEEENAELFQQIKENFGYDELVEFPIELIVNVGYSYDGTDFYRSEGLKAVTLADPDPDLPIVTSVEIPEEFLP